MTKIRLILGLAMACAMTGLAQTDVNFTTGEGYTDAALNAQNGWSAEFGWTVDASGSASAATVLVDQRAVYGGDPIVLTGVDNGIKIRVDFSYAGTPATPSANTLLGAFGVGSVASTTWTEADVNTAYLYAGTVGTVRLRNDNNTGNLSPNAALNLADIIGDDLAIEYTIVLGSSAANSTFQAKLINVTDATESALGSYTGLDQNVFDAATTTGVFPTMWGGTFTANGTGITGVTVYSISWEAVEVLTGTTVDFTNPPYVDGELNNQIFWNAQGDMVVDTAATTVRTATAYRRAISGANKLFATGGGAGDSAIIKADFYFEDVLTAENKVRANFGFTSDYANSQKITLRSTPGGTLELRDNSNATALGSIPIPGSNDALRITYSLTLGADAASSQMEAILYNKVNANAVTGSYAGIASDIYNAATNTGILFRYQNGQENLPLVLDQVNFDEVEASEPPPPLPEGCVDFVNPPYVDGQLNGQRFWSAPTGGSGFTVDTTATTVRRAQDWGAATYGGDKFLDEPGVAEGDSATATVDFYFEGAMAVAGAIKARFGFTTDFTDHHTFYLSSTGEGVLKIRDNNNVDIGVNNPNEGIPIPGTNDALRMTYTLTLGADAASSEMRATLSNTVSGASAETWYVGISSSLYTKATNGDGFWFKYSHGLLSGTTALVIDQFCLEDSIAFAPSGFDLFVEFWGLSGGKTDHSDADSLNDWGEYVFGGNPTDPNNIGTQPAFDAATGDYNFTLIGDDTVVAHVVTTADLVSGSWVTNATVNVTATDLVLSNYTENVGTAVDNQFIQLLVE